MEKLNSFLFHNLSVDEETLADTSDLLKRATGSLKNLLQQFAYLLTKMN